MNSLPQNSHLTLRLGQSCCRWSGRSRRVSLTEQRLGQGITLKAQVEKWPCGGGGSRRDNTSLARHFVGMMKERGANEARQSEAEIFKIKTLKRPSMLGH